MLIASNYNIWGAWWCLSLQLHLWVAIDRHKDPCSKYHMLAINQCQKVQFLVTPGYFGFKDTHIVTIWNTKNWLAYSRREILYSFSSEKLLTHFFHDFRSIGSILTRKLILFGSILTNIYRNIFFLHANFLKNAEKEVLTLCSN
jgi:hypothetical protein